MAGDEGGLLEQSEIEALFGSVGSASESPSEPAKASGPSESSTPPKPKEPAAKPRSSQSPSMGLEGFEIQPFSLGELTQSFAPPSESGDISLIYDVDLEVRVELGRSRLYIEDVLRLREGSIIQLDKLAGDPVDIYVNGRLLARGEVLVLNDNFCVRISEVLGEGSPKIL